MLDKIVTIYNGVTGKEPHYLTVNEALKRIRRGKSSAVVTQIRTAEKPVASELKKSLPAVVFAGKFSARGDHNLMEPSNLIVLDFDKVEHPEKKKASLMASNAVLASWVSPSGNGVKALVKIADGRKLRQHFAALKEIYPDCDPQCANPERLCFESYDPDILINADSTVFTTVKETQVVTTVERSFDPNSPFEKLVKWLTNKGDAFVEGNRNAFVFKLATACCSFGINENDAVGLMEARFPSGSDFTSKEMATTIKHAYRHNSHKFGSAEFTQERLTEKTTTREISIAQPPAVVINSQDIIYANDVKEDAIHLFRHGYEKIKGIGLHELDKHYKKRKTDMTLWSGIGNYGKSSYWKWYHVCRALKFGEKYCVFTPEDMPAHEYYVDLVEIVMGKIVTPGHPNPPTEQEFLRIYEFVQNHFIVIYPNTVSPTPEYIKQLFSEVIIKHGIDGVCIDPFNQMANDYGSAGGRSDKYLETVLSDFARFAKQYNVYFDIIAHPKALRKAPGELNYPCPDVFDIADGAMWNNKMDNILIYHRPNHQEDPNSRVSELHAKKIRRQKTVGVKGVVTFELDRTTRRFVFGGYDIIADIMRETKKEEPPVETPKSTIAPNTRFYVSSQDKKDQWEDEQEITEPNGDTPF